MKIWAVITQKGGSGKTTLALHLAIVAQSRGLKTAVIDVDPQRSALRWANIRGDAPPDVVATIAPDLAKTLAGLKERHFDLAVIDTSPRADRDGIDVSNRADLIIVPVRPSILDIPAVEDTLRLILTAGKLDRTVVVLNAVPPRTDEGAEAAQILNDLDGLGARVLSERLGDRVDFRRALTGGRGVTEYMPASKAAKEVTAIYDALSAIR